MPDLDTLLMSHPLFGGLQPAFRRRLAAAAFLKPLGKGEALFRQGDRGSTVYVLVKGQVQAQKTDNAGGEAVIKVFQPGEMFAQVILFESPVYPVTVTALECSTVLGIHRRDVLAELSHEPFRHDFIAQLMRRQRFLTARLASLTSPDIEDRLRQFLRDHYGPVAHITCRMKRKDLAAAIGVTPETLSRWMSRLKKAGRLSWTGETMTVHPHFWQDG